MLIKVFRVFEHAEQAFSMGVLQEEEGGWGGTGLLIKEGGQQASCLVAKQAQAVEISTGTS